MLERAVVSVAVGKTYYLNLASNLIRSFLAWNKGTNIHFLLLTDNSDYFNLFRNEQQVIIKQLNLHESEKSFTSKFLLMDHIIAEENLFIDSDCLIYKPLGFIFDKLSVADFTAIGTEKTTGNFFCNIATILQKFNLPALPTFVGSVYYFKHTEKAKKIFKKAIELKKNYDADGFVRLRNKENEEPLLAVAMAIYQQHPIHDDHIIKVDLMDFIFFRTNVNNGTSTLISKDLSINLVNTPAIIHFNDKFSESSSYLSDQFRLTHNNQSKFLVEAVAYFKYKIPEKLVSLTKDTFRPIYHRLLGPSKVKITKRS